MTATHWAVGEVDHLFNAVARYTRFVLFSKWFFGILAVLMLVGLIAWPLIGKDQTGLRVSFQSADGTKNIASPVMETPHFVGNDEKGQRYEISGKRAIQISAQTVRIEEAEGQLLKPNGSVMAMRADVAIFHQDSKTVELSGNVNLFNDQGTMFVTPSAKLDTNSLDAEGTERIEGTGPNGNLVAIGFKIRNKGTNIVFGTAQPGVKLHIEKMRTEQ